MPAGKISLTLSLLLLLISCSSYRTEANKEAKINKNNRNGYEKVHSLFKKDGTFIGDVYVSFINDDIFKDLYVIDETDTIYSVSRDVFSNAKGEDIRVFGEGFFGYRILLKKQDYIVLSYLRNTGANVSDDITIEWNYDHNVLEVQKVP